MASSGVLPDRLQPGQSNAEAKDFFGDRSTPTAMRVAISADAACDPPAIASEANPTFDVQAAEPARATADMPFQLGRAPTPSSGPGTEAAGFARRADAPSPLLRGQARSAAAVGNSRAIDA